MLTERVALVTGAGRGIGAACAEALAKAGATVVAADIDASLAASIAEKLVAAGHRCLAITADCGSLADIERMVTAAIGASAQATYTGPIAASVQRRQTCTTIGSPWMSASGFPGNLEEAMRAGMTTTGFME